MGMVSGGYDGKKRGNSGGINRAGGKLRDIYAVMLKHFHVLPDEVGRQNPQVLFDIFDSFSGNNSIPRNNNDSPYIRAVFG